LRRPQERTSGSFAGPPHYADQRELVAIDDYKHFSSFNHLEALLAMRNFRTEVKRVEMGGAALLHVWLLLRYVVRVRIPHERKVLGTTWGLGVSPTCQNLNALLFGYVDMSGAHGWVGSPRWVQGTLLNEEHGGSIPFAMLMYLDEVTRRAGQNFKRRVWTKDCQRLLNWLYLVEDPLDEKTFFHSWGELNVQGSFCLEFAKLMEVVEAFLILCCVPRALSLVDKIARIDNEENRAVLFDKYYHFLREYGDLGQQSVTRKGGFKDQYHERGAAKNELYGKLRKSLTRQGSPWQHGMFLGRIRQVYLVLEQGGLGLFAQLNDWPLQLRSIAGRRAVSADGGAVTWTQQ